MAWSKLTTLLLFHVVVICLGSLQFGYHLSELNAPEAYFSCQIRDREGYFGPNALPDCIPMGPSRVGLVNSIFSVGGFISATIAGRGADRFGRRGLMMINSIAYIVGPVIVAVASNFYLFMLGRFVSGLGAGSMLIVIPIYLNEISPVEYSGMIGAMCQEFVNLGILFAQVMGVFLSSFSGWRVIVSIGGIIGIVNLVLLPACVESPKWLALNNRVHDSKISLIKLRGLNRGTVTEEQLAEINNLIQQWRLKPEPSKQISGGAVQDSTDLDSDHDTIASITPSLAPRGLDSQLALFLEEEEEEEGSTLQGSELADVSSDFTKVSYHEFLTSRTYRRPLIAVVGVLTAQQLCGINTMIFYGVTILSSLFPTLAVLVNVVISLINCLVNLAVAPLVDRVGRRPLLLLSESGMAICSFLLAIGITRNVQILSGLAATVFVAMFSIGLGPIPFLIIPELTDASSVAVAQSVGFTCNWVATFLVGYLFPILNQSMGGYVFFILSGIATFVSFFYFFFLFYILPSSPMYIVLVLH
ncbi:major facilitator superfamily domain-containing protein [Lipomyces japonicus]|uniref:major facilitator superfamily domain-containing protein n=1 Tax=Lipomyces japonicus TaxID=56871 RepID=UPI0034CD3E75